MVCLWVVDRSHVATHLSRSLVRLGLWSMVSGRARHWSRELRVHRMARESPADATHSLLPRWKATEAVVPLLARLTPDCTQRSRQRISSNPDLGGDPYLWGHRGLQAHTCCCIECSAAVRLTLQVVAAPAAAICQHAAANAVTHKTRRPHKQCACTSAG